MVILGFTCVFLGFVLAIMFVMALGARGITEEKRKEAEAVAEKEKENEE